MTTEQIIGGVKVALKPIETTREFAIRGAIYRKLTDALKASDDDELRLLGEDTNDAWRFVYTASAVVSSEFGFLCIKASDTKEALVSKFCEWLAKPPKQTLALHKAVEALEVKPDPKSAPKEAVDPNSE